MKIKIEEVFGQELLFRYLSVLKEVIPIELCFPIYVQHFDNGIKTSPENVYKMNVSQKCLENLVHNSNNILTIHIKEVSEPIDKKKQKDLGNI